MQISRRELDSVLRAYRQRPERAGAAARKGRAPARGTGSHGDRLTLSDRAREVQDFLNRLDSVSEVREDRVNGLAERIRAGTYNVAGSQVADQILGRLISDRLG